MVPWSIKDLSAAGLAHLFNSKEMFHWDPLADGFEIKSEHGDVLPSAPNDESRFMFGGIVGGDSRTTIKNLLDWCRSNLTHFLGAFNAANCTDQWQYRGFPPVNRIIQGTVITSRPGSGVQHLTAGCWGTTGFLRAVLRTVNIPVRLVTHCTHALPNFIEESLYLSHGDDPYNPLTTARPPMPISEILISEGKYNEWFGFFVNGETQCNNIGRRVTELAIDFLPDFLLETYCEDQAAGRTHENGKVRELFKDTHTLKQLEDANLWQRMDTKLNSLGGCSIFRR
jgi:hypothetical protein